MVLEPQAATVCMGLLASHLALTSRLSFEKYWDFYLFLFDLLPYQKKKKVGPVLIGRALSIRFIRFATTPWGAVSLVSLITVYNC